MENASKALIIAGAILLSILIIALGMRVYNNANSAAGSANLSGEEINAHNQTFRAYANRQKGSEVKALLSKIQQNNKEYLDRIIDVNFSNTTRKIGGSNLKKYDPSKGSIAEYVLYKKDSSGEGSPTSSNLANIRNEVKDNTTYYVTFGDGANGCINYVEIHVASTSD